MTLSPPAALLGSPPPRVRSAPVFSSSAGTEAVELAASAGLHLDQAQQLVLHDALGERSDGKWAAFEVGVCVARQNMKGAVIEARELAGLFLFGERLIMHTAHQFDTALEAFRRVLFLIESTPDLDSRIHRVSKSHGEEGIELKGGQRLRFKARTKGGGRGFTGDCVILDEAMILPAASMSALMPTMSARPNPQLWYLGSAVDKAEHPDGKVFSAVRARALSGDDPSLSWTEWGSQGAPDEPTTWAESNPGVAAGRISLEHIAKERRSMTDRAFRVERLSVDDYWWTDEDERAGAIPDSIWQTLIAPAPPWGRDIVFALDVAPDHSTATIAAAWKTDTGSWTQLADTRPGVEWVVSRSAELLAKYGGRLVVEQTGTAAFLLPRLDRTETVSRRFFADACSTLDAAVQSRSVRHGNQPELNAAVGVARWSSSGEAGQRVLSRKNSQVSPLVAVALALHGLESKPTSGGWVLSL